MSEGAYFKAMHEFDWALGERRFPQALVALKAGLRATKKTRNLNGGPFLSTKAGIVVALLNDTKTLDLMDSVAEHVGNPSWCDIGAFREDASAIAQVRAALQTQPEISLDELKNAADPAVRSRLARLLSWMEKNSELSVEKSGKTSVVKAGPAPRKPSIVIPSFRENELLATPLRKALPPFLNDSEALLAIEGADDEFFIPPEEESEVFDGETTPLPPADRLPGVMETHVLRDGFWLIGSPRSLPNGAGETNIIVKSKLGEALTSFVLPHAVIRAFSTFKSEHIVVLDSTLSVVTFDLLGNFISGFSLAKNPEVRFVVEMVDAKATRMIRGIDISPVSGDIAFSVLDYFWRFTSDGQPLAAFRIPSRHGGESESLAIDGASEPSSAIALRTTAELAMIEPVYPGSSQIDRDWIYFVRFSDRDDSLFVSTYSGNFLRMPRDGNDANRWDVNGSVEDLLESDDGGLAVSTWAGLWFINADGTVATLVDYAGDFYSESLLVGFGNVFNLTSRVGTTFSHEKYVRGIYPMNGKLRVEMKTSYIEIDLP